jgi:hypothetical protein
MTDADTAFEEEEIETAIPPEEVVAAKKLLSERE